MGFDHEQYMHHNRGDNLKEIRERVWLAIDRHEPWVLDTHRDFPGKVIIPENFFFALADIAHEAVHPDGAAKLLDAIFGGDDEPEEPGPEEPGQTERMLSHREDITLREYALQSALQYAGIQTANEKEVLDLAGQAEALYHFLAGGLA